MKKKMYKEPKMGVEALNSDNSLMQLVLGSPTAIEPGKQAPKRVDPVRRTEVF